MWISNGDSFLSVIEDWESIILIDAKYLWNNICNIFGRILFVFISRHTDLRYLYLRHNVLHVKNYFQYLFLTNKVCIGFWPETFWSKRDAFLLFHEWALQIETHRGASGSRLRGYAVQVNDAWIKPLGRGILGAERAH